MCSCANPIHCHFPLTPSLTYTHTRTHFLLKYTASHQTEWQHKSSVHHCICSLFEILRSKQILWSASQKSLPPTLLRRPPTERNQPLNVNGVCIQSTHFKYQKAKRDLCKAVKRWHAWFWSEGWKTNFFLSGLPTSQLWGLVGYIQSLALAPPSGLIIIILNSSISCTQTALFFFPNIDFFFFDIKALVVHSLKQYLFILKRHIHRN